MERLVILLIAFSSAVSYAQPLPPTVVVSTELAGGSAEQLEREVSVPLEKHLNVLSGVKRIRSSSTYGKSIVEIEFIEWGRRECTSLGGVPAAVAAARASFPTSVSEPKITYPSAAQRC